MESQGPSRSDQSDEEDTEVVVGDERQSVSGGDHNTGREGCWTDHWTERRTFEKVDWKSRLQDDYLRGTYRIS